MIDAPAVPWVMTDAPAVPRSGVLCAGLDYGRVGRVPGSYGAVYGGRHAAPLPGGPHRARHRRLRPRILLRHLSAHLHWRRQRHGRARRPPPAGGGTFSCISSLVHRHVLPDLFFSADIHLGFCLGLSLPGPVCSHVMDMVKHKGPASLCRWRAHSLNAHRQQHAAFCRHILLR